MSSFNRRHSHHAQRALTHARILVTRYQHPRMDTGHLLVGVMLTKGSIGYNILAEMNLSPDLAGEKLKSLTLPLEQPIDKPAHDAALDAALDLAADESMWLGHHYIGTEHFLLGITRTNVGNAVDLLSLLGVKSAQLRRRVRQVLQEGATEYNLSLARRDAHLSELSRRTINAAEQMAVAMDHPTVGAGHLLKVLISERRSLTSALLLENHLNGDTLQAMLEAQHENTLITLETVMLEAKEHAQNMGSHFTGTEHLLLAMAANDACALLLDECGASPEELRTTLESKLHNTR